MSGKGDIRTTNKTTSGNICDRDNVSVNNICGGLNDEQKMLLEIFKIVGKHHAEPSLCMDKCMVFYNFIKSLK